MGRAVWQIGRRIGQRLGLLLGLACLLSGCFQSDLTLRFDHQTHGQIIQSIDLGERGLAIAHGTLDPWLADLRPSVNRLGGSIRYTDSAVQITVPFSTGADLVDRFSQVFATTEPSQPQVGGDFPSLLIPGLGLVPFNLSVHQQSWGIVSRTHLIYDLDLRELNSLGATTKTSTELTNVPNLTLQVQTPWGIGSVQSVSSHPWPVGLTVARWSLQLGQVNHIDVVFWLPNLVGLGAGGIVIAVLLGYFLRYRVLSPPRPPSEYPLGKGKNSLIK